MKANAHLSFDFGTALNPDYVLKCSYGNDSIALIQWMHERNQKHPLGKVVVLYNDTGWSVNWWEDRVRNAEENLVKRYGFTPTRTSSVGMRRLVLSRNCWPNTHMKFCTEQLKIRPTMSWLTEHDPEAKAVMVVGVRRAESFKRSNWPEWVDCSDNSEGRSEWAPLVHYTEKERDDLIIRAGWVPLRHRSRECRCVLANAKDLSLWTEDDIKEIESIEQELGSLKESLGRIDENGHRFMFRPSSKSGNPEGIRQVVSWAHKVISKREKQDDDLNHNGACDSGFCGG